VHDTAIRERVTSGYHLASGSHALCVGVTGGRYIAVPIMIYQASHPDIQLSHLDLFYDRPHTRNKGAVTRERDSDFLGPLFLVLSSDAL
jgi:hypothetical protein